MPPSIKINGKSSKEDGVRCLQQLLKSRLPGGNDKHATITTQGSLMLFQNLKAWFALPFQDYDDGLGQNSRRNSWNVKSIEQEQMTPEEEASEGSESANQEEEEDDDDDVYSDYSGTDNMSAIAPENVGKDTFDIGISSQAEAYYAHQVTNELMVNPDDHTTVLPSPSSSRLDYVITQLDIVRMHRNASRHLDVESIYKLPTITYRASSKGKVERIPQTSDKSAEGWSWMFVPDDNALDSSSLILQGESEHKYREKESNICVICMENFVDGDRLRILPCNHSFHVGCIDRWLSGSCSFDDCHTAGCPTCKKRADACLNDSNLDGSVPSWAFARLGRSLARDCSDA